MGTMSERPRPGMRKKFLQGPFLDPDISDLSPFVLSSMDDSETYNTIAERENLRNVFDIAREQSIKNTFVARLGEQGAGAAFDLPATATPGILNAVDLKIIEVRARLITEDVPSPDLSVDDRDWKKSQFPLLLVRVDIEKLLGYMVGWLLIAEARYRIDLLKHGNPHNVVYDNRKKCWFVPPPYHSTKSLRDWIACGAPKHTWKAPE